MEIHVQKTEKVFITKKQQKDIAVKVMEDALNRVLSGNGTPSYVLRLEFREKRAPGAKESEVYVCSIGQDYRGGEDISWIREASEEESTLYNSVKTLKRLINENISSNTH